MLKKILVGFFVAFTGFAQAQSQSQNLTLNFESGNRAIETGNCWAFGAMSYYTSSSSIPSITGAWSGRSNSPTNLDPGACWIKTPWIIPQSGNITFNIRFESANATYTTRRIIVSYIPVNPANFNTNEGALVRFDSITYTSTTTASFTTPRALSFQVPSAIVNSSNPQPYKIQISLVGTGGTVRYNIDDLVVPGTYQADPSNGCRPLVSRPDADGDGVADTEDDFPNDATLAYKSFYPASTFGTYLFEDNWPMQGDYDFNDLVLGYRYEYRLNSQNKIVSMQVQLVPRALGAAFNNGFGIQFDNINQSDVVSVTGARTQPVFWLSTRANGTENGVQEANIIVSDNMSRIMPPPTPGRFVNTESGVPYVNPDTIVLVINFRPGSSVDYEYVVPNPYLLINGDRAREIHLVDNKPTSKMNIQLLGTGEDASSVTNRTYFRSVNKLPWALDIPAFVPHTFERTDITTAYLRLADWARSNGTSNQDWYEDIPAYRNVNNIYRR
ncbi:MAG: LruC domain-containing protein [Bacteroidetes bacterium]|nr:MAG: LruC domain-containing protein [Bacteroidota bacterium]